MELLNATWFFELYEKTSLIPEFGDKQLWYLRGEKFDKKQNNEGWCRRQKNYLVGD